MKHIKKFLAMLMAASIIVVSTCAGTMPAQGNSEVDVSKEQVNEVSALAAADNRIPLSVLDVAQWDAPNNNNNTILHGTEGAVATFDADVATCWKQGGNNIVIDLGGWYDVSEISLVQMTSGPGNTFAVYGSGNSADLQTLALDDQSRASVFCLYSDKAGANGIMTNTKRDLNINSTTATSAAALKNIRYLKVWRGNQLFDIKVFGSLVTEATDKRIPLTESMLIGHSAGKNGTYMVDGAIPGKYWNESPAAGVQPYILLDLGAYYKLSDFKVFHLKQTVSYDLYAGREVDTLAKCGTVDVSAFGAYPCKVSLDIPVRYVKLVKTTDPWMQTMELCLYGKAQGALTYHDVTFDSRNGAANTTVKVESGKTIGESFPANPVNGNYGFMGWYYKDSSGQEQQLTSTTVISEKIDAYAKWQIVHTVTFMNGANIHATVKNVADGVAIGSTLIPPSPSWADESFIFGGWFSNVGGIEAPFNADTVVTADVTVNAKWNALIPSAEYFDISRCVYINNNELLPVAPATTAKSIACLFDGILFNQNTGLYNIDAEGNKDVVIDLGGYYNLSNIMLACTSKGGVATLRVAENYSEAIKGGGQVVISYTSGLPEWYSASSTTAYSNIRYLILNKNWNGACELKLYGARTDRAIKNYTVSFATNGGTAVAPIQVEEHHYLTLPASPTKEGLHFIDWYTDNNFLNIFDQTQAISSDLTLYARYSPKVPINAELDNIVITGGISGTGKNIACLFDGDYVKGYGIKDSDTLVVDLKRECNLTRMLITIYNYGTGGKPFVVRLSQNADFTNAATVNIFRTGSAQDAEKKSYDIFMCNVDASNVRYVEIKAPVADRGVMGLAELEFYGDVVGSSGIRPVTFDLNGGTGTPPPTKEYLQGASVDLPKTVDASKYRHSFIGWALTPSATQALASYEMGANPVTFYAVWQEEPKYTLTLDLGTGYTQEYTDFTGTIVSLPSQMQRSGYLFDAWYDAEGKPFSGNKYTISACNITLTARWNYILTLSTQLDNINNQMCGNVSGKNETGYRFREEAILTATANTGYRFVGWFKVVGINDYGIGTQPTITLPMSESITIYARFVEESKCAVSFVDNSGTICQVAYVSTGSKIGILPTVGGALGNLFKGWFDSKKGGTSISKDTVVSQDMTVYARYERNPGSLYRVQVVDGFINQNITITDGTFAYLTKITVTPIDVSGKQFQYWMKNSEIVSYDRNYSFEVKAAVNLKAVFGDLPAEVKSVAGIALGEKDATAGKIYFVVERNVAESCTLVEAGVLLSKNPNSVLTMLSDYTVQPGVIKSPSIYTFKEGTVVQGVKVPSSTAMISICSYVVYRTADGKTYVSYSRTLTVSLESVDLEPPAGV